MSFETIKTIPQQPLAIFGDIHGEYDALNNLLKRLEQSQYSNRKLIFIGDLCDRGPKSISVISLVHKLVDQGKAYALLGNHEINLLADDAKDGSGWFFDSRRTSDNKFYAPYELADKQQKENIYKFLNQLPIAIETPDLRMIHAAWDNSSVTALSRLKVNQATDIIAYYQKLTQKKAREGNLYQRYQIQKKEWLSRLEDPDQQPPYLNDIADFEAIEHKYSDIKRLTSGIESPCNEPFFSGNRWRFSDRIPWWNQYTETTPVIIGHYWRLFKQPDSAKNWRYSALFNNVEPLAWHGLNKNVFCVDYSVGARWRERKNHINTENSRFKLACMLWPERKLMFDDGLIAETY